MCAYTDLCVSVDGLWGDGRCGRTCHSRDNPWRMRADSAHDAGTEAVEYSQLPSPSPPQHLEHTHTQTAQRDKWKVCWVPLQTSPPHITTHFFFFLSPLSVSHCPPFPLLKCANAIQSQIHQTGSQTMLFSSLTERWQFISFSVSLETP